MHNEENRKLNIGPFIPTNSDGCTALSWPYNKLTGKLLPFRDCCIVHDEAYWYGGTKQQRKDGDLLLMTSVQAKGDVGISKTLYFVLSRLMYVAVRIGGSPKTGLPWRWQFSSPFTTRTIFGGYEKDRY